jgi:membrane protein YdbS with pleckstrin-like domain
MRLDPKKVRFVFPTFSLGLSRSVLRFVGRENTVQLSETALAVEGNLLKVGLMGVELLFRRALAEWSSVTIPYSRITRVRYVRFPLARLVALLLFCVCAAATVRVALDLWEPEAATRVVIFLLLALGSGYVVARISPRFVITFRSRGGRRTGLKFQVTSRQLRREFDRKLREYREAARRYAPPAGSAPEPADEPAARSDRRTAALLVAVFLLLTAALTAMGWDYFPSPGGTAAVFLIAVVVLLAGVVAAVLLIVPIQAYRRGYGFVSWFVLQIAALNPVYPLILLATLPNKARARLREELARELDSRLSRAVPLAAGSPAAAPDRSVGDLPTATPDARSIGDDPTRP